jgi:hypothetical protein
VKQGKAIKRRFESLWLPMDEAWLSNAGGGASVVRARIICEGEK